MANKLSRMNNRSRGKLKSDREVEKAKNRWDFPFVTARIHFWRKDHHLRKVSRHEYGMIYFLYFWTCNLRAPLFIMMNRTYLLQSIRARNRVAEPILLIDCEVFIIQNWKWGSFGPRNSTGRELHVIRTSNSPPTLSIPPPVCPYTFDNVGRGTLRLLEDWSSKNLRSSGYGNNCTSFFCHMNCILRTPTWAKLLAQIRQRRLVFIGAFFVRRIKNSNGEKVEDLWNNLFIFICSVGCKKSGRATRS